MKNLLQPEKLANKTYDELVAVLENHYEPKQSVIVQRYKFNTRVRHSGESVAAYVASLKAIGEHCSFDKLEEMVRDRLICGVGDSRAMLQEKDLTYQKALELTELATKDISLSQQSLQKMLNMSTHRLVSMVATKRKLSTSTSTLCYRCGGDHSSDTCRQRNASSVRKSVTSQKFVRRGSDSMIGHRHRHRHGHKHEH